ncbi:MAG: hypothetical protein FJ135_07500 [Deltaproteobacteria bacterium]|nr:hypothetical protein [Deltaproteobacteria bacterium]
MKSNKTGFDLLEYYQHRLAPLVTQAPYVLRLTEWKDYPPPVMVIKERREVGAPSASKNQGTLTFPPRRILVEIGHLYGAAQRHCLPILRQIIGQARDNADIPLELQRYLTKAGLRLHLSLPLDEEVGAKLGLFFRLQLRVKELERVELMARRVATFTREEAAYWLSRTTRFGPDANRWAISGLRLMLGGQPGDPAVLKILERLRFPG